MIGQNPDSFFQGKCTKKLTGNTHAMSYVFDVEKDKEGDMERFLKWYTNSIEPSMNYKSKLTVMAGLTDIQDTIIILPLIFVIGILIPYIIYHATKQQNIMEQLRFEG